MRSFSLLIAQFAMAVLRQFQVEKKKTLINSDLLSGYVLHGLFFQKKKQQQQQQGRKDRVGHSQTVNLNLSVVFSFLPEIVLKQPLQTVL